MSNFKQLYLSDLKRYDGKADRWNKKFHYYFRKCQTTKNGPLLFYYRYRFSRIKAKHGMELYYKTRIGEGLYVGHPYNITINPDAVIGKNCNLHKGAVIGQENRGKRKGTPTIGNNVWIGINAAVVGNITVGDNVLIAPNSYVNCDIPANSIVFGNPCVIKPKENATEGYIVHTV